MASINGWRAPDGAWRRRIAFCCVGVISTTLMLIVLFAVFLVMSGVLEW